MAVYLILCVEERARWLGPGALQFQRALQMVLDLWQGLLRERLQIGIGTVYDLVFVEGGVGVLVVHLSAHVVRIERLTLLMLQGRDHCCVSGFQERRRRRW